MFMFRTIRLKLFISYSIIIIFIIATLTTTYYVTTSKTLENKSYETLNQSANYISEQLDNELKQMDILTKRAISFPSLRKLISRIQDGNIQNMLEVQWEFNDIMLVITAPQFTDYQTNIFTLDGNMLSYGNNFILDSVPPKELDSLEWIKKTIELKGFPFINVPRKPEFINRDKTVISLSRAFSSYLDTNRNIIIEVERHYDIFKGIISRSLGENVTTSRKVLIFNNDNKLIYPTDINDENYVNISQHFQNISSFIMKNGDGKGRLSYSSTETKENYILSYRKSDYSGWYAVVMESEKQMLKPVRSFRSLVIILSLFFLIIIQLFSFYTAHKLSKPIKRIHENIKKMSLDSPLPTNSYDINSNFDELENLNSSYIEMCQRLKDTLEQIVTYRSQEIKARMLALQSQMNPHFLYNTLSTITILAENQGQTEIMKLCKDLAGMLRYISSGSMNTVSLNEEINHTVRYLEIMKKRYGDSLTVNLDIPKEIMELLVPKLIVQPLVENSIKYGMLTDPPWMIKIKGKFDGMHWKIEVSDSGTGFEQSFIDDMVKKLEAINTESVMPDLKLDGMGLINICSRIRIYYGGNGLFSIGNHPNGGAFVIIGGTVKGTEVIVNGN